MTVANSDNLMVGDVVFAIGNPLGVGMTVTMGIVSATERTNLGLLGMGGYENFIQTDASINVGNSGGALVDAQGRLVGINTAIMSLAGGNIGLGFAIPMNLAKNVMLSLVEKGVVERGAIGVLLEGVSQDKADSLGWVQPKGAMVRRVVEGKAGGSSRTAEWGHHPGSQWQGNPEFCPTPAGHLTKAPRFQSEAKCTEGEGDTGYLRDVGKLGQCDCQGRGS